MATLKVPAPLKTLPGTTVSYVDSGNVLRVIAFDATLEDNHEGTATVSKHPLDINAKVANHVRSDPRMLTIQVEVTNTPCTPQDGGNGTEQGIPITRAFRDFTTLAQASVSPGFFVPGAGTVGNQVTFTPAEQGERTEQLEARTLQFSTEFDRVREVYEALDALRDGGEVVQVVTRLRTYQEAVIVRVGAPHGVADAIVFSVTFEEIRRASSETVQVDPPVGEKRAEKTKAAGSQAQYEPPEQKQTTARATLTALADIVAQR